MRHATPKSFSTPSDVSSLKWHCLLSLLANHTTFLRTFFSRVTLWHHDFEHNIQRLAFRKQSEWPGSTSATYPEGQGPIWGHMREYLAARSLWYTTDRSSPSLNQLLGLGSTRWWYVNLFLFVTLILAEPLLISSTLTESLAISHHFDYSFQVSI